NADPTFNPPPGSSFVILQSTGGLSGQFTNHPEGDTVTLNGHTFVIHYVTGGSNHLEVSSQVILVAIPATSGLRSIPFGVSIFVTVGDVNGDGFADIICGADAGGGANITVFSGKDQSLLLSFFPYGQQFTGGVRVAAGDTNGDGIAEIVTGAGAGGGPNVTVF